MELRTLAYDHDDAGALVTALQREYVELYGGVDRTPVDPFEFAPPAGYFVAGYVAGQPVACGGWRRHDGNHPDLLDGDAEIKRMYVVRPARGRGHARRVLAELERSARVAGIRRLVLETGAKQPEAISLYVSAGYTPISGFGIHRGRPLNRCFGKVLADTQL
ncbi:MAG TPA: GNAT family N-acetyltransferase [Actinopolymorphaceae bacterium]|nr:GNAT family N-acetyltransferase [Actinopolymorphaceae bacterium]